MRNRLKRTAFLELFLQISIQLVLFLIMYFYKFNPSSFSILNSIAFILGVLFRVIYGKNSTYLTYAKSDGESIILNHIYGFKSKEEVINISKSKIHLLNLKKKKKEAELIIKEIENDVDYVCYKTHTFKIIDNQLIIELTKLLNNPENKFMIS